MYVDVRDLAIAHLLAVTKPKAGGKRIIVSARAISSQQISDVLRSELGDRVAARVPLGKPGTSSLDDNAYFIENTVAREVLGCEFREDEETFGDLGKQILEIENRA